MADNEGKVTFTADAAQAVKELEKLERANDNLEKKLAQAVRQSRQAAKENTRLANETAAALERLKTPAEAYLQTMQKHRRALQENMITQQQFDKLRDAELAKLNQLKAAQRENSAEFKKQKADEAAAVQQKAAAEKAAEQAVSAQRAKIHLEGQRLIQQTQKFEDDRFRRAKQIHQETRRPLEIYNGKVKELNNLLAGGDITQQEHTRQMARYRDELRRATGQSTAFQSATKAIAGSIAIAVAATRLFVRDLADLADKQEKIREKNVSVQRSLSEVRANFVADETVSRETFDSRVNAAARATGTSVEAVATALGPALSAKGSLSNEFGFQATEAALRFTKDPAAAAALTGGIGDFGKMGGSQDPEAILGFLSAGQQQARITSVEKLARNAAPAVNAALEQGLSPEQGMEFFAAFTQIMADPMGEQSGTAMVSLMDKLGKAKGLQGNALERLAMLQQDPKLRARFLKENTFEAKAGPTVRMALSGDERWMAALAQTQATIPSLDAASDEANKAAFRSASAFNEGQSTVAGQVEAAERLSQTASQQAALRGGDKATIAQIRKIFQETLERNVRFDYLPDSAMRSAQLTAFDVAATSPQAATEAAVMGLQHAAVGKIGLGTTTSASDREAIREQIEILKQLNANIERLADQNHQDAEQNTQAVKDAARQPNANKQSPQAMNSRGNRAGGLVPP